MKDSEISVQGLQSLWDSTCRIHVSAVSGISYNLTRISQKTSDHNCKIRVSAVSGIITNIRIRR